MHNYFYPPGIDGLVTSDYIAIIAIIVSILSLLLSIYIIYLAKRMEILYQEFDNLCLKNVESIFTGLDKIFDEKELKNSKEYRSQITSSMVELQLFLVSLRKTIYPKIDVQHIVDIIEPFTEKIYNSNANLLEFKSDYYSTKLAIYNSLYKYALKKELRFFIYKESRRIQ